MKTKIKDFINENASLAEITRIANELGLSSKDYFNYNSDVEPKIDVREFEDLGITDIDFEKWESLIENILKKYGIKIESFDDESVVLIPLSSTEPIELQFNNFFRNTLYECGAESKKGSYILNDIESKNAAEKMYKWVLDNIINK